MVEKGLKVERKGHKVARADREDLITFLDSILETKV